MSPEQQLAMRLDFAKLKKQFKETGWISGSFTDHEQTYTEEGKFGEVLVKHCLMGAIGHIWELGGVRYEFRDEIVVEATKNEDYGEELKQMILALGAEARKRVVEHHYDIEYTQRYHNDEPIQPSNYGKDKDDYLAELRDQLHPEADDYHIGMHTEFIMTYNDSVHGREFAIPELHVHRAGEAYGNDAAKVDPYTVQLRENEYGTKRMDTLIGTEKCTIDCARWIKVDQETALQDLYKLFDHVEKQQLVGV